MIATFLLDPDYRELNLTDEILYYNPSGYLLANNIYENLISALKWAILNDEDVIYCVCNHTFKRDFAIGNLSIIFQDIVAQGVFSLYVDATYKSFVTVNSNFLTISNVTSVSSFFIFKPVYKYILSLLEKKLESDYPTFIKLIEMIIPSSFLLIGNNKIVVKQNKLHIISPFRNAKKFIGDYFRSILKQKFTNYQITLIDDGSTDGSMEVIPEVPFVNKIVNKERKFALQNIVDVLMNEVFDDEDIICLIDADDMLSHKYVLNIVNNAYQNNSILMTYGSMSFVGDIRKIGQAYSKEEFDRLRSAPWKLSHLRTFKFKVFRELLLQDERLQCLRDEKGDMIRLPYDMALLFPLLELAGYENILFINSTVYKYRVHSENDQHINRQEQYSTELEIRKKVGFRRWF